MNNLQALHAATAGLDRKEAEAVQNYIIGACAQHMPAAAWQDIVDRAVRFAHREYGVAA